MTPEELQAELEKIIRMKAGLEPVDLRYDVNKDGIVSEIDAILVNLGFATIPPVTTTPPKTIPPVTTPPTTTATVTTTAPDAYQKQLDADALARGRERYVLEAEKILGRKLTPEEATSLGQAAYPEIQRYTDPKTGAKSYMFPYYDVGSYFRDKLTDEEKQRLDRQIDSSVINAAQKKLQGFPLSIEEQERLKGLYGYEDALTYGGVGMPLDSQGNPKFLSALSESDLYNEIVSGVTARQAAENQAAADRAVYDAARLEGRAYNGTIYDTKEAAQKAFLDDATAQGRVYNGTVYATKEAADYWKSIDDEFARIKEQERLAELARQEAAEAERVKQQQIIQAGQEGRLFQNTIYDTPEQASAARADYNRNYVLNDQTQNLSKFLGRELTEEEKANVAEIVDYYAKDYQEDKSDRYRYYPSRWNPDTKTWEKILDSSKSVWEQMQDEYELRYMAKFVVPTEDVQRTYVGLFGTQEDRRKFDEFQDKSAVEKVQSYMSEYWRADLNIKLNQQDIERINALDTDDQSVLRNVTDDITYEYLARQNASNPNGWNELADEPPNYITPHYHFGNLTNYDPSKDGSIIDYLRSQNQGINRTQQASNTFIKVYKNVDGKLVDFDPTKVTQQDLKSGNTYFVIGGEREPGHPWQREWQLYNAKGDFLKPVKGEYGQVYQTYGEEPSKGKPWWQQAIETVALAGVTYGLGSGLGTLTGLGGSTAGTAAATDLGGLSALGEGAGAAGATAGGIGSSLTSTLTSALPTELVQAGKTLANTFNTVRPYIQGANAVYQASQGNLAGAISSGLGAAGGFGVPGAAEAAKVFNLAYGAAQGNYLPVVQELLNQSGFGGTLANTKIAGDFTLSDAFKGASFLQALQSGNPTVILNAAASLTGSQDLKVAAAANNFVNILNNPRATAFDIAMGADRIAGALNTASNQPPPKDAASHAQNLPRSNTAIGAVAVDDKGELYIMDDDGNRTSLTGVDAGRVYTPTEWNSIQAALSTGQAQYVNDLIGAMNNGTMKPEEVVQDLKSAGYSDDTISKIQQANQQFIDRANKAQQLAKDYSEVGSDIDRDNAIKQLEGLGFKPADATRYIDNIDRQVTARNDYANIARDFVANNLGTSEQAITKLRDSLANVGVTGDQQDEVVDAYNKMRLQAAGADLTPSEMTNLAVLAANKTNWVALPGKSGHEVAFALTDEGDPYVVAARDKDGNNLLNVYQNLTPQGVMQVVNAQLAQSRAAEQTKGAPNQYAVDKEISDAASAAGLVRTTGMIRNNFSTVNTDYFNNLLRQYSAMSPEDRAKIASASGVTTDLRVLKDIDAQYKAIDQQYAAAVANNSPAAKIYKSLDTRVENKAGYYYTNNGVQPSTAMAMAVQDLQGGNLFNRENLSEVQDSKFPFETKEFINQFRGTPAGDTLANVLSSAYAVAGSAAANTLNGALGINLHIAEAMGMDTFANDFRKLATGIKTAGDDAIAIANASTDAHKNLIGGLSNAVSAIPWLVTGLAPGLVAGAMATTYGNEYIQGRLAGQSIEDAGKRATLMAVAEGIGERIGADELVGMLKPLWRNTPTDQLGKVIGESLVNQIGKYGTKEQLGEMLSYSLQAGVDKIPQIGMAQNMTGMDFLKGALDTLQQTFVAAGANTGLAVGLRGGMTPDNSGAIKVISPDGSQGLVELGNGSVIRVDLPDDLGLKVGEQVNVNALQNDVVYVPDNVNEKFANLQQQVNNAYLNELNRAPTFEELDFNVKRLANGVTLDSVITELNNTPQGKLLDDQRAFTSQTDAQIAANAKSLLDQGKTTYADFKTFMDSMGLASDRQLNVLDTITPRANVAGTVTSIIGDNAVVTGTDGQMYTMLRVAPNNYLMQVGDQVKLGVSTVKPTATPTVEVTTKIADVIAASVSKSTSISLSQSVSEAAVSTSISKSQSLSVSYSQSQSLSASTSVSVSESQSKSISLSQSVSTVELEKSISLSKSVSTSVSTSASLSTSTSLSQSVSASTSTSQSVSASISKAVSISEAVSLSASVSEQMEMDRLKGLSISASLSESISQAVSVSESISKAVSISESTSASISTSQSISQATSISQSLSASTSQSESVSKATSISASVSASTSASLSASTSQSISLSQEVSKQVSISQSTSQSIALSQSLSQSQAVSVSASVSESVSKSASASLSLSQSTSAALSTSVSQSLSLSQKMSEDVVRGLSISASLSASESVSQSVSRLVSASISTSQSASTSLSLSESISKATQLSISNSLSASASVSQSQSLSASQSVSKALSQSVSQSLSLSESVAQSVSQSLSVSAFQSQSLSVSEQIERDRAVGISISNSLSQSVSLEASKSQSISISTSTQQSISNAVSLSESVSISTYLSQEVSRQTSLSQSLSTANSLSLSLSQSQSLNQSLSQAQTVSITPSITQTVSVTETIAPTATVAPSVTESITQTVTQSVTESITEVITQSLTESLTLSITESITQPITLAPTIMPSVTLAPSISVTETFTQTPSLTMVITTTSLPPVTTTITIPPVTTTEPVTTEQVTTVTIPPVTPPPTSGTIPPVTTPSISVPDQTTTAPITTLPVTTAPITTAVTTARPPTTTARPPTTTARPGGLPFPIFGIPAATGQQTTYIDYAQPKVPAPEFGPYDLFKAPSYLRPLQDSGNFGLAALIGAASESQQRNGDNQSQQNAESQGQAPTG